MHREGVLLKPFQLALYTVLRADRLTLPQVSLLKGNAHNGVALSIPRYTLIAGLLPILDRQGNSSAQAFEFVTQMSFHRLGH